MKKTILITTIIGLVVILVIGSIYFFINEKSSFATDALCAKEGETIGVAGMPEICCPTLKTVGGWPGGFQGDCFIPPPPTGLSICSNCGNGICDIPNGENKCNCPEDC